MKTKNYPDFFDHTLLLIPFALERVRINTPYAGMRNFRVAYIFGVRVFVSVVID